MNKIFLAYDELGVLEQIGNEPVQDPNTKIIVESDKLPTIYPTYIAYFFPNGVLSVKYGMQRINGRWEAKLPRDVYNSVITPDSKQNLKVKVFSEIPTDPGVVLDDELYLGTLGRPGSLPNETATTTNPVQGNWYSVISVNFTDPTTGNVWQAGDTVYYDGNAWVLVNTQASEIGNQTVDISVEASIPSDTPEDIVDPSDLDGVNARVTDLESKVNDEIRPLQNGIGLSNETFDPLDAETAFTGKSTDEYVQGILVGAKIINPATAGTTGNFATTEEFLDYANAGNLANNKVGDFANIEVDEFNGVFTTYTIIKTPVPTDFATNPANQVEVDGTFRRAAPTLEIPNATSTQDGLMSSEDKIAHDEMVEKVNTNEGQPGGVGILDANGQFDVSTIPGGVDRPSGSFGTATADFERLPSLTPGDSADLGKIYDCQATRYLFDADNQFDRSNDIPDFPGNPGDDDLPAGNWIEYNAGDQAKVVDTDAGVGIELSYSKRDNTNAVTSVNGQRGAVKTDGDNLYETGVEGDPSATKTLNQKNTEQDNAITAVDGKVDVEAGRNDTQDGLIQGNTDAIVVEAGRNDTQDGQITALDSRVTQTEADVVDIRQKGVLTWDVEVPYETGANVLFGGFLYRAKQPSTGEQPSSVSEFWAEKDAFADVVANEEELRGLNQAFLSDGDKVLEDQDGVVFNYNGVATEFERTISKVVNNGIIDENPTRFVISVGNQELTFPQTKLVKTIQNLLKRDTLSADIVVPEKVYDTTQEPFASQAPNTQVKWEIYYDVNTGEYVFSETKISAGSFNIYIGSIGTDKAGVAQPLFIPESVLYQPWVATNPTSERNRLYNYQINNVQGGDVPGALQFALNSYQIEAEGVAVEINANNPNQFLKDRLTDGNELVFRYATQARIDVTPRTEFLPDTLNENGNIVVPVPGNNATIQVMLATNNTNEADGIFVLYGQVEYADYEEALANVDDYLTNLVVPPQLIGAVPIIAFVLTNDVTSLVEDGESSYVALTGVRTAGSVGASTNSSDVADESAYAQGSTTGALNQSLANEQKLSVDKQEVTATTDGQQIFTGFTGRFADTSENIEVVMDGVTLSSGEYTADRGAGSITLIPLEANAVKENDVMVVYTGGKL